MVSYVGGISVYVCGIGVFVCMCVGLMHVLVVLMCVCMHVC